MKDADYNNFLITSRCSIFFKPWCYISARINSRSRLLAVLFLLNLFMANTQLSYLLIVRRLISNLPQIKNKLQLFKLFAFNIWQDRSSTSVFVLVRLHVWSKIQMSTWTYVLQKWFMGFCLLISRHFWSLSLHLNPCLSQLLAVFFHGCSLLSMSFVLNYFAILNLWFASLKKRIVLCEFVCNSFPLTLFVSLKSQLHECLWFCI